MGDHILPPYNPECSHGCISAIMGMHLSTYHTGAFAVQLAGKNYLSNLRNIGKTDEAERLSILDWEGVGPPKLK